MQRVDFSPLGRLVSAVNKGIIEGAVTDMVLGRKRKRAVILGLIAIGIGVAILFYSGPISNRVSTAVTRVISVQGSTSSISSADVSTNTLYAVLALGGLIVGYGTNKIRRGQ